MRLPPPIERHVARAVPAGAPAPRAVRLVQAGEMRQSPRGRWLGFHAVERLSVARVEFEWRARFPVAPLLWLEVVDGCRAGAGHLSVRLWGRVPVMTRKGPALARGQAMRYLAELPWAPHAMAANDALEWRALEDRAVEVATGTGAERAVVRLAFDDAGDVVSADGVRPRLLGRQAIDTPWRGAFGAYRTIGGVRVPTRGEVAWILPDGPFVYWRGTVTALALEP